MSFKDQELPRTGVNADRVAGDPEGKKTPGNIVMAGGTWPRT